MKIRPTNQSDHDQILDIHREAFGRTEGPVIAQLVDDLFNDRTALPLYSFAAQENNTLLGHILFTRVEIDGDAEGIACQILAPLAVLPNHHAQGIGAALIRSGLEHLKIAGVNLVFVLGHPTYYPRCGFSPAGVQGLAAPYPIPEKNADAWMVQELRPGMIGRISGTVRCAEALDRPEHWRE